MKNRKFIAIIFFLQFITINIYAAVPWTQGIYINEGTMQNVHKLQYLINQSKAVGINTFVVDYHHGSRAYQQNINLVKQAGIKYVARIVVFPNGAKHAEVLSLPYREGKYMLVQRAVALGADGIQLDYVRYNTSQKASSRNAENIYQVVKWFKTRLQAQNIPLEIDVFGVTSFGDSLHIGQSVKLFAGSVDALCPMVYPSHFEPYLKFAKMPYYVVRNSLESLREQFYGDIPFKIYAYIELSNYRYPLSRDEKLDYILEQLLAVKDSQIDGWYAWSPNNQYNNLFLLLKSNRF